MEGILKKVEIISAKGDVSKVSPEMAAIIGLAKGKVKNTLVFTYDSEKYAKSRTSVFKRLMIIHDIAGKVAVVAEGKKVTVTKL